MRKNNWILPLVVSGLSIHLLNNRLFSTAKDVLRKKEMKQRVYAWKFGNVSYKKMGAGQPLLLIHDTFSGSSSIEFDRLVHQLSKNHEVYLIDLLGYGFSEKANITYTAYLFVQLIIDFIHEVIEQQQVDIICSGQSNLYAILASQQEKDLIRKLIMINPSDLRIASINPSKRDHTLKYILDLPFIGTSIYNILHSKGVYINQFNVKQHSETLRYYIDQFYYNAHFDSSNTRFLYASYLCSYMNVNIEETLKEANNSLYIINGTNRSISPDAIENQYTDLNPSIECARIKQSSDFPHLENPFSTVDLIQLFLND